MYVSLKMLKKLNSKIKLEKIVLVGNNRFISMNMYLYIHFRLSNEMAFHQDISMRSILRSSTRREPRSV